MFNERFVKTCAAELSVSIFHSFKAGMQFPASNDKKYSKIYDSPYLIILLINHLPQTFLSIFMTIYLILND